MRVRIFKVNGQRRLVWSSGKVYAGENYWWLIRVPWWGGRCLEIERKA